MINEEIRKASFQRFKAKIQLDAQFKCSNTSYRVGQHAFNSLPSYISQQIVYTPYDPFFDDTILPVFWQRVEELWYTD